MTKRSSSPGDAFSSFRIIGKKAQGLFERARKSMATVPASEHRTPARFLPLPIARKSLPTFPQQVWRAEH